MGHFFPLQLPFFDKIGTSASMGKVLVNVLTQGRRECSFYGKHCFLCPSFLLLFIETILKHCLYQTMNCKLVSGDIPMNERIVEQYCTRSIKFQWVFREVG